MKSSAKKVELAPYDDLFSTEESRQDAKLEKVREIPLSELHPFKNHPFKVKDDEAMMETADSVRQYGVLVPAIARPDPEGGYELVAGHRRHRASELAEKETMPVIVRDLDDDAATIIMVDSNLQRESLLPSERAFAYKMKLEAMKHQGERMDLTCSQVGKGSEPVQIGSYRGFTMSVEFSAWKQEYTLLLKGQMTHRASLGTDPRGNLTRIDNALSQMSQRLEATKAQLDNLYQQQAAAKEEVGKPFPYEDDLRVKSARLVELDTLLNLDGRGRSQPESVIAKSARPSVLDSLKRPVPPRSPEKKPKQHEEVR